MLSRGEFSHDQRWYRALTGLGLPSDANDQDPQVAIGRLAADRQIRASIVSCITGARDNASQVREEISSEMWERLNRLFHEVAQSEVDPQDAAAVIRLVSMVREGSYSFYGATETSMSHGEGWRFVARQVHRAPAPYRAADAYSDADQGRLSIATLSPAARRSSPTAGSSPRISSRIDREVPSHPGSHARCATPSIACTPHSRRS
jgi:hypothetical protein